MQGKSISGYTLQRLLGTGGMAEVWYAENKIGKKAAVKLLLPKLCQDENVVSRFLTEAKVMVELNHPNIRQVYDYGDIDGRPAIVMEYLDGSDLKARLKRGQRFTQEELVKWWNQLADALNYTHKKGIVHRDIKPGNIFVDREGDVKLLDFGIAKVRESISKTQTGQKLGTLMYMSPEQVKDSKHIDYRTDVYSLAVTFVHLITGKKPYDSDTSSDFDIQLSIVSKPLGMIGVPEVWQGFLSPYLNKAPEQRPDLLYFEGLPSKEDAVITDEDEGTIVGDVKHPNPRPIIKLSPRPQSVDDKAKTPEPSEKPKNRRGLWIGLGVAAAVLMALLFLMLKPEAETIQIDPDTESYQACHSVADYRAYLANYGRNAIHYSEAKRFVDSCVADSMAQVEKALAEAIAKEQAEKQDAERAEAAKKEETAYKKCTSIAGCKAYLKNYPEGKYVAEVKAKLEKFEKEKEQEEKESVSFHHVSSAPQGVNEFTYFFNTDKYSINDKAVNKVVSKAIREKDFENTKGFRLVAYAAPGESENIAKNRAKAVEKELNILLSASKVNKTFDLQSLSMGPDLQMIVSLINASSNKDKDAVIYTLQNASNKEQALANMCAIYPFIEREIMPLLRKVEVYVY